MMARGYGWAGCSILLVSGAQLLMKFGMMSLPAVSWHYFTLYFLHQNALALLAVSGGILGYTLSMLCWFLALRDLPLNRAYPLLGLSYALVYLAAIFLPWLGETASWSKNLGVLAILAGVWLVSGGRCDERQK